MENRKIQYSGKYLKLETFPIQHPDGRTGNREIVHVRDAVGVLLLDDSNQVHLVKQFRHAIDKELLEVPAGLLDPGESPEDCAVRECEEETGYYPQKLHKLLHYAHAEGYSTGFTTLYLGTNLRHTGKIQLDESEYLTQHIMPLNHLIKLIYKNEILDSKTILCTLLGQHYLQNRLE